MNRRMRVIWGGYEIIMVSLLVAIHYVSFTLNIDSFVIIGIYFSGDNCGIAVDDWYGSQSATEGGALAPKEQRVTK